MYGFPPKRYDVLSMRGNTTNFTKNHERDVLHWQILVMELTKMDANIRMRAGVSMGDSSGSFLHGSILLFLLVSTQWANIKSDILDFEGTWYFVKRVRSGLRLAL
jgi:hypothetical protein